MNHMPPHPHHAMRNDPSQYMQPPHYPNAHPMPTPQQRNMMNPSMEPGYQMNNQQPPHVQMMHPSKYDEIYRYYRANQLTLKLFATCSSLRKWVTSTNAYAWWSNATTWKHANEWIVCTAKHTSNVSQFNLNSKTLILMRKTKNIQE